MSGPIAQCSEEVEAPAAVRCVQCGVVRDIGTTCKCGPCDSSCINRYGPGSHHCCTVVALPDAPPARGPITDAQALIAEECDAIKAMLLAKNEAYGNSALEPVRVFSKAPTDEQIRVRLDDKLSRLARGSAAGEDVEADIIGYLVLLRVSRRIGGAS